MNLRNVNRKNLNAKDNHDIISSFHQSNFVNFLNCFATCENFEILILFVGIHRILLNVSTYF